MLGSSYTGNECERELVVVVVASLCAAVVL